MRWGATAFILAAGLTVWGAVAANRPTPPLTPLTPLIGPTLATPLMPPPPPKPPTCEANWRSCASDEEVANNWHGWSGLRFECERAASAHAKYGEPKWPHWYGNFGSYMRKDASFVKEGKAVLLEPDAQFQNRFGAMVHVRVECSYDLANDQVTDVSISESDLLRVTDEDLAKLRGKLREEQAREEQARKDQAQAAPRAECHPTAYLICDRFPTGATAKPAKPN